LENEELRALEEGEIEEDPDVVGVEHRIEQLEIQ
jgi:hypothetical protein